MIQPTGRYTAIYTAANSPERPVEGFADPFGEHRGIALVADDLGFLVRADELPGFEGIEHRPATFSPAPGKSLTVDDRWDYVVVDVPGQPDAMTMPFIGWTVEAVTGDTGPTTRIVPVFLDDPYPVTLAQFAEYMGGGVELRRLVRVTPPVTP